MHYQHREIEKKLIEYIHHFPVTGLTGPRQSGKSTLLLHTLKDYRYVTFDDYRIVNFFYQDPQKFMATYANKVIFDEVQKAPELFNYIKIAVDQDRSTVGKFIITGSSQFSFIKGLSETLAGRIGLLSLLPYQFSELPKKHDKNCIFQGTYPELVSKNYHLFQDWMSAYLETYLQKDIASLAQIGDMRDFRRLLHLLAINTSQQLNLSRYANDLGVDVKTIKRWISLLEASYIIFLLPPFYENFGKRIVKSPKIYFYDTGLVSFLTGIDSEEAFEKGPMAGSIFENYIVSEILKKELHRKTFAELFYFRTSNGEEIDLIVDRKNTREWIEIKNSYTFHPRMMQLVEKIVDFEDKRNKGYLLYRGENFPYNSGVTVSFYQDYLEK